MKKYIDRLFSKRLERFHPKNLPSWVGQSIWALALFGVFMVATDQPSWRLLEYRGFDSLTHKTAVGASSLPIVIVGIDDRSVTDMDQQWPWPRSLHAKLIDRLHAGGAAVIAFDVVFNGATTPAEDGALEKAIANAGNVVLISASSRLDTTHGTIWERIDPLPAFVKAGAKLGMAKVEFDPDLVVRRFPKAGDALWKEVLFRMRDANPQVNFDSTLNEERLMRYLGPDHSIPYVSYSRLLGYGDPIPEDAFSGALVLVGRETAAVADVGSAQVDVFATPFTSFTGRLTPGVELHATMIDNAVTRTSIGEAHPWTRGILLFLVSVWSAFVPGRFSFLRSALAAIAACGVVAGLSYGLFVGANLWVPFFGPAALALSAFLVRAFRAYSDEIRQKSRIRAAFSLFVPQAVADRMAAQSAVLEPGGEEVELTSMFTDLAGFTSISEGLQPAQVAQLLNIYFDHMTEIVFRNGGTVQGYIGDALFAFWGAPLPDPAHRSHGAAAAQEMVAAQATINARLMEKGLPGVQTRIGLHSGTAIVGNIGSKVRFNYTALGDTINLSSRLEGLNKRYGTSLLVSADALAGTPNRSGFRRVEKVRVKGRDQAVEVFTPCNDTWIVEASDRAIDLFLARDWAASTQLWKIIVAREPGDVLAGYYMGRIAELEGCELDAAWDGIESISEK